MGSDIDFRVGTYATSLAPHRFETKIDILSNNYPRAAGPDCAPPEDEYRPAFPPTDRAAYCIPIFTWKLFCPAFPLHEPEGRSVGQIMETQLREPGWGSF